MSDHPTPGEAFARTIGARGDARETEQAIDPRGGDARETEDAITSALDEGMTATDRQAAARAAYLASVKAGTPLTGAELGRRFDRTDRWGRTQIAEARAEADTGTARSSSSGRNGSEPCGSRDRNGRRRDRRPEDRDGDATGRATEPPHLMRNGHAPTAARQPILGASPERSPLRPPVPSQPPPGSASAGRDSLPLALTAVRWLTTLTVLAIALAAGRASYDHQRAFAEMAGEDRNAWSLPLSVDGMMIVASLTMLVRRWQNKPAGQLAWAALLLGGLASLGANITVAEPTMAGRLAAAWPPMCLLVSIELLLQQIRDGRQGS